MSETPTGGKFRADNLAPSGPPQAGKFAGDTIPVATDNHEETPSVETSENPFLSDIPETPAEPVTPEPQEIPQPVESLVEAPQVNLFAPETQSATVAEEPTTTPEPPPAPKKAERGRRRAVKTVSPKKKAAKAPEPPASIFHEDDGVIGDENPTPRIPHFDQEPHRRLGAAARTKSAMRRVTQWLVGLLVGLLIGSIAVGYLLIVAGPYQLTNLGVVKEDLPVAINAVPSGTLITVMRHGADKPSGIAAYNPIILGASLVRVDSQATTSDGEVGYQVTCVGGECIKDSTKVIPFTSIIGGEPNKDLY